MHTLLSYIILSYIIVIPLNFLLEFERWITKTSNPFTMKEQKEQWIASLILAPISVIGISTILVVETFQFICTKVIDFIFIWIEAIRNKNRNACKWKENK